MENYLCFLITVLYQETLFTCAMKINSDLLSTDTIENYMEPENRKIFYDYLPEHIRSMGPVVFIEPLDDVCLVGIDL